MLTVLCWVTNSNNLKVTLGIYSDLNDILRCKGRINNSELPMDTCRPILLPKRGHFVDLIIERLKRMSTNDLQLRVARVMNAMQNK